MKYLLSSSFFSLGFLLASLSPATAFSENALVTSIEAAHGGSAWASKEAFQFRLELDFGGKPRIYGSVLSNTEASLARIELDSGEKIVFDGKSAWLSPADSERKKARFDALTWPYFVAAPFKLDDTGANAENTGKKKLRGQEYDTVKITFDSGVGDSPDDWYIAYQDPETKALLSMSYIVTYGGKKGGDAHAIVYEDFKTVDGVVFATKWSFYKWSEATGIKGEPIGQGTLSDIKFVNLSGDEFIRPENSVEDKLPQ